MPGPETLLTVAELALALAGFTSLVAALRRDRDKILSDVESLLGKDLEALRGTLQGGITSLEQASRAAASALRVVDEVVPQLAWEWVRAQLPDAREEQVS